MTVTLVVGGPDSEIARCRPVLETIVAKTLDADAAGAGSVIVDFLRVAAW
jgi:3-hydroxyisobutyrate dehydrogenase-like beta-hydroxyacid dehydrogenase